MAIIVGSNSQMPVEDVTGYGGGKPKVTLAHATVLQTGDIRRIVDMALTMGQVTLDSLPILPSAMLSASYTRLRRWNAEDSATYLNTLKRVCGEFYSASRDEPDQVDAPSKKKTYTIYTNGTVVCLPDGKRTTPDVYSTLEDAKSAAQAVHRATGAVVHITELLEVVA